jgi:transcriptional regulatory protein LevR
MYRQNNNKRVILSINIKNQDSLVKIINEFIAHLTSPLNLSIWGKQKLTFGGVLLPSPLKK